MIKFFRKIRQNLVMENKTSKYLKYAVGEILLVVIGILLALQINNWNEKRLQQEQLILVYDRILADIDNDVQDLTYNFDYYSGIEFIFKRVINDSITPDLFDEGLSRILTNFNATTSLNMSGVNQLKALNVKDSMSLKIIDLYDNMELRLINDYEKSINQESMEVVNTFRDNYDWYPEYMSKTIMQDNSSKELQDYFLYSSEYRHRVISNYQLLYVNYITEVKYSIETLNEITEELEIRIENHK